MLHQGACFLVIRTSEPHIPEVCHLSHFTLGALWRAAMSSFQKVGYRLPSAREKSHHRAPCAMYTRSLHRQFGLGAASEAAMQVNSPFPPFSRRAGEVCRQLPVLCRYIVRRKEDKVLVPELQDRQRCTPTVYDSYHCSLEVITPECLPEPRVRILIVMSLQFRSV